MGAFNNALWQGLSLKQKNDYLLTVSPDFKALPPQQRAQYLKSVAYPPDEQPTAPKAREFGLGLASGASGLPENLGAYGPQPFSLKSAVTEGVKAGFPALGIPGMLKSGYEAGKEALTGSGEERAHGLGKLAGMGSQALLPSAEPMGAAGRAMESTAKFAQKPLAEGHSFLRLGGNKLTPGSLAGMGVGGYIGEKLGGWEGGIMGGITGAMTAQRAAAVLEGIGRKLQELSASGRISSSQAETAMRMAKARFSKDLAKALGERESAPRTPPPDAPTQTPPPEAPKAPAAAPPSGLPKGVVKGTGGGRPKMTKASRAKVNKELGLPFKE